MTNNKARLGHYSQITDGQSLIKYITNVMKTFSIATIIVTMIATCCAAASEMASANLGRLDICNR